MDILADVRRTFCRRPHKIPADAEYWNSMSDRCTLRPQNCPTGIPADVRSLFLIIFFCLLADVADIVFQYSAWMSIRCPQGILAENSCNGGHLGYGFKVSKIQHIKNQQFQLALVISGLKHMHPRDKTRDI